MKSGVTSLLRHKATNETSHLKATWKITWKPLAWWSLASSHSASAAIQRWLYLWGCSKDPTSIIHVNHFARSECIVSMLTNPKALLAGHFPFHSEQVLNGKDYELGIFCTETSSGYSGFQRGELLNPAWRCQVLNPAPLPLKLWLFAFSNRHIKILMVVVLKIPFLPDDFSGLFWIQTQLSPEYNLHHVHSSPMSQVSHFVRTPFTNIPLTSPITTQQKWLDHLLNRNPRKQETARGQRQQCRSVESLWNVVCPNPESVLISPESGND